jgi:hypothetical protein
MQVQPKMYADYSGGLNDTANPQDIADNEASLLRNWDITYVGQLRRRDGLTLVGNSISANPITGLDAFIRSTGTDLLATESTNLWYLNGSTWGQLANNLTAGNNVWMENVQTLNKIYIANQDNTIKVWDRVSTTLNTCLTDLGAAVPHGNVLKWYQNHMFALNNVTVSGVSYPNRLYWSALGDPTTWTTASNYVEVPGDGRILTAMDLGDQLVIFKERSITYLSGYGDNSWQLTSSSSNMTNLSEEVGLAGTRAAVRVGNEIWFMDNKGQIRRIYRTDFDAFRHELLSTKIQGTLNGLNKPQLSLTAAWINNNKVYFAVPNGSDTHNSLVLVYDILAARRLSGEGGESFGAEIDTEAWTTYTGWTPSMFADFPSGAVLKMYVADATTGKVYQHTGTSDNGVAIDARWDSKDDSYGNPDAYKVLRFGYANAPSGTGTVGIYASVNLGAYANVANMSLSSGSAGLGPTGTFRLGPTGTSTLGGQGRVRKRFLYTDGGGTATALTVRHSLRHSTLSEQPIVNNLESYYKGRQIR